MTKRHPVRFYLLKAPTFKFSPRLRATPQHAVFFPFLFFLSFCDLLPTDSDPVREHPDRDFLTQPHQASAHLCVSRSNSRLLTEKALSKDGGVAMLRSKCQPVVMLSFPESSH